MSFVGLCIDRLVFDDLGFCSILGGATKRS